MLPPLVQLRAIGKSFGPHRVLNNITLAIHPGEVHILAGENGAGKSTLIKILAGIHTDYDGTITLAPALGAGSARVPRADMARPAPCPTVNCKQEPANSAAAPAPVRFTGPHDANRRGISVIHQEMSLIDTMNVAENIFLGHEPTRAAGLLLDRATLHRRARDLCAQLDLHLTDSDLSRPVSDYPLAIKNRIEIAKALSHDARLIIMDEPTSALNATEVERLFRLIETLRARGCAIIYITHKMEEIYRIADRITVLRDGKLIGTAPKADCPQPVLLRWMIGRDLETFIPTHTAPPKSEQPALSVRNFTVPPAAPGRPPRVSGATFDLHPGEILGLAGLQGSGASDLLQSLFGAHGPITTGEITLADNAPTAPFGVRWQSEAATPLSNAHPARESPKAVTPLAAAPSATAPPKGNYTPTTPRAAIARGLALLTGDRKGTGLIPALSVQDNLTLAALPRLSPRGLLNPKAERAAAAADVSTFQIRARSLDQPVSTLSGGNQQKVILAKWLRTAPKILLLEEPTRGVDIGAKHEIYEMMNTWTASGVAILMVSTEMPELLRLCDRILVLHRGQITAQFPRAEATPERILAAAMGLRHEKIPNPEIPNSKKIPNPK